MHLEVRFQSAADFVVEYAENLSLGGLFIAGAHEHPMLSEIEIELKLPQFQSFHVTGRVAHVLSVEDAKRLDRRPGAGIELIKTPEGFDDAIHSYLAWLGLRRARCVIATDPGVCDVLEGAGYGTSFATSAVGLDDFIDASKGKAPVLAILVSPEELVEFAHFGELVVELEASKRNRGVITLVDRLLIQSQS